MLKLMISVLAITNELSIVLQHRHQDIGNAIHLVKVFKVRLQRMRDSGWEQPLQESIEFCGQESIEVPNMDDIYVRRGKSKWIGERVTCFHHFQVECGEIIFSNEIYQERSSESDEQ